MRIRVADKRLGECIINSSKELDKGAEYAVKSLCMIQLMCMNTDPNDAKFLEFIRILRDATKKLELLYDEGKNEPDPFEQFNASVV